MRFAVLLGRAMLALAVMAALSTALAQDWTVSWHTIDGGGEVLSETQDQTWLLSGTIGQPDARVSGSVSGPEWTLTGGFWPVTIEEKPDAIFRDGFEPGDGGSL
ncbi:MAG: hypothetical protein AAGI67_17510 [Pseudomonadota bacterium]